MKVQNIFTKWYIILLIMLLVFVSCITEKHPTTQRAKTIEEDSSYDSTVSPDGKIEAAILLHSRMGIRIAMNLNKRTLDLWISPQAGKSVKNRYRNFSCRDDHTSIFDKIWFPELHEKAFIKCDYDPFHSVLYFKGQTMHIASLLDKPVVLIWFEEEEVVDFKSDKQDALLVQSPKLFGVRHPDRGLVLDFYAGLSGNDAVFQHQPEVAKHRSIYARTVLNANQFLVIGGELEKENVRKLVEGVISTPLNKLLSQNTTKIEEAVKPGSVQLKNAPEIQKLYEINQKHLLSVQDASGVLHAALRYVYYLIWVTDGSVTATSMMQTGNSEFLRLWCDYMLANPTSQDAPPEGRFYGQLVNEKITKREEFGSLCAVWPAFMYWGLTGDDRFVSGEYLTLLMDVVDWLERYCYDDEMGAIGTFYLGGGSEDPFIGSNDFGYDAAVGSFMNRNNYAPTYESKPILKVYEFNMNLNMYNMYLMLSAVTEGDLSKKYINKAKTIEKYLQRLDSENALAYYLLQDKGLVQVKRKKEDLESGYFAVQNDAPAFFMPNFPRYFMNRMQSFEVLTDASIQDKFGCKIYGELAGLDVEFVDESEIIKSLQVTLPYHIKPSRYVPMPYTMVEYFGAEEGTFHDIRPQAFTAGPFQSAVTNLAVRTMPFGIALRGSNFISELTGYHYMKSNFNITYSGAGEIDKILINGKLLENSLQVPDEMISPGDNNVQIELKNDVREEPNLVYSTVRLLNVKHLNDVVQYQIKGYCQNVLVLKHARSNIVVKDSGDQEIGVKITKEGLYTFVEFWGKGDYVVENF